MGAHDEQRAVGRLRIGPSSVVPAATGRNAASPMNAGDEAVDRAVVDVVGRAVLLDAPGPHDGDAVADRQRLGLVVGHEQRRGAGRAQHVDDVGAQAGPQVGVEAGERLVEQHEPRLGRQRPGEGDALALAAGQLVRVAVAVAGEPDHAEPVVARAPLVPTRHAAQAERDVVGDA